MIRTLFSTTIFGVVIAGLGFASAEASPLLKSISQPAANAAQPSLVQYYPEPHWYYGPKWGGYGSEYEHEDFDPSYRYYGPAVRGYGPGYGYRYYGSPRYRYYGSPGYRYYGSPGYREPRWFYGPKWGGW